MSSDRTSAQVGRPAAGRAVVHRDPDRLRPRRPTPHVEPRGTAHGSEHPHPSRRGGPVGRDGAGTRRLRGVGGRREGIRQGGFHHDRGRILDRQRVGHAAVAVRQGQLQGRRGRGRHRDRQALHRRPQRPGRRHPTRPQQGAVGRVGRLHRLVQRPGWDRRPADRARRPRRQAVRGRGRHGQGVPLGVRLRRRGLHPGRPVLHRQGGLGLPQVRTDRRPGLRGVGAEEPVQRPGPADPEPAEQEVRAVDHGLQEALPGAVGQERGRLRRAPVAQGRQAPVRRSGAGRRRHPAARGPQLPRGGHGRLDAARPEGDRQRCRLPLLDR